MNKDIILKKEAQVKELAEDIKNSKAVLAFKYQGLTVEKISQLRKSLYGSDCCVKVIKNNISRRAIKSLGYDFDNTLSGPVALIFSKEDIIAPAKGIFKFAKENDCVNVLRGIVDGSIYEFEQLQELSNLPNFETMLSQLAYCMYGPLYQLAIGLNMICEQMDK